MLIDPSGSKITQAIAPSLPSSYNDRFPGMLVNREGGPCTEAARRNTQVIVSDVASDPHWDTYGWRTAALSHGLKACWSTTILALTGLVLGTRFRRIVDTIPGFVCTLNVAGELELVNRQVLEYFGKTLEQLKNWATSDAVHPDGLPRVIDAWRRSVETGQPYVLELRQRRSDGVYRWFQSHALPERDTEGCITDWYILLTDIDDRKRAESELTKAFGEIAKSEDELRIIIDAIPQLIVAIGTDGKFLNANQAVLVYTGLNERRHEVGKLS